MITKLEITGIHYTPDALAKRYVGKKIGRLDRFVSRHARKSITAEVKLLQVNRDHGNKYECEVILGVPEATITAKDSTLNMLAAIDIVEAKLRAQLKKYKDEHTAHRGRRSVLGRLRRRLQRQRVEAVDMTETV